MSTVAFAPERFRRNVYSTNIHIKKHQLGCAVYRLLLYFISCCFTLFFTAITIHGVPPQFPCIYALMSI